MQKIKPDSNVLMTDESYGGLTQRELVFILQRANISDSVCKDLRA